MPEEMEVLINDLHKEWCSKETPQVDEVSSIGVQKRVVFTGKTEQVLHHHSNIEELRCMLNPSFSFGSHSITEGLDYFPAGECEAKVNWC